MKLVKFEYKGKYAQGIIADNTIAVIGEWHSGNPYNTPFSLPSQPTEELIALANSAQEHVPLAQAQLLAPISPTSKIICLGYNYKSHIEEVIGQEHEHPTLFARWPDTLVGHDHPLTRPLASDTYDFEGEFAIVIGKHGRRISPNRAQDHVFGYSCFFDGSIRAYQKHSVTAGKNFPGSGSMGPWIVAGPETSTLADTFKMTTRINHKVVQSTSGELMVFDVPTIIAYVSEFTSLSPGDVISTGTPGGVGALRTPPLWLKDQDAIEVEISGIGTLRNTIRQEEPQHDQ